MAKIKNTGNTNCRYYWWKNKVIQSLWKTVWQFLVKLNILHYMIQQFYSWMKWKHVHMKIFTWMFTAALMIIAQKLKPHKCPPTEEWIHKLWYNHTRKYYLARRKGWLIHMTWMNLKNIILIKRGQIQKSMYYMILFIWNSKTKIKISVDKIEM